MNKLTIMISSFFLVISFVADAKEETIEYENGDEFTYEINNQGFYGVYEYASGTIYEGQFSSDMEFLKGEVFYSDGDRYDGKFKNDRFDGHGTYWFKNGDQYTGQWKKGKKHGLGTYKWSNGDHQRAEYKYNQVIEIISSYSKSQNEANDRVRSINKKECQKAARILDRAESGTAGNVFAYLLTGGSNSNQRDFENNLDNMSRARDYLSDNNCSQYINY